jgi:MoaA/NifB/PqqE/SkfB family radical SAM enzyme
MRQLAIRWTPVGGGGSRARSQAGSGSSRMGDVALPYILPMIANPRLETAKFTNLLAALHARRNGALRVAHRPIDATIDLVTACQLKCPYCSTGNRTIDRNVALMSPERYRRILANIGDQTFVIWYFSTGEPLLHKQFGSLLASSQHQEVFSAISTNLSLRLSDQRIDEILGCGLKLIMASIDGATEETYRRYRVGGRFGLVLENLRRLIERKRELGLEYPLIEWRFLRFRHNQHEEAVARAMARSLGVDLLEFFSGYAPDTASDDEIQAVTTPLQGPPVEGPAITRSASRQTGMLGQLLAGEPISYGLPAASTDERKCDWLYYGMMIYPDGAIGPCCVVNDRKHDFADLDDCPTVADAWRSPRFQMARAAFALGTRSGTICDACPMPSAQTYQFGQKLRGILRIAPPWVLRILDAAPEMFFLEIDRLLMPLEVGAIVSGRLRERFPEIQDGPARTAPALWRDQSPALPAITVA